MDPRRQAAPDAALHLLGLAARAGALQPGTERVREAARNGTLRLAIVAEDVSDNSLNKLLPLLQKRGAPHVVAFTRDQLGGAVGRGPLSAVGLTNTSLANRLRDVLGNRESGSEERGIG